MADAIVARSIGMKSSVKAHRSRDFRIHSLVADFEPSDVWRVHLPGVEGKLGRFTSLFWEVMGEAETWAISRLRVAIGKVMGWDEAPFRLPIPGCSETRVGDRLTDADRKRDLTPEAERSLLPTVGVRAVYR